MNFNVKIALVALVLLLPGCKAEVSTRTYEAQISELLELRDSGLISDKEYRFKKRKVINSMLL